MRRQFAIGSLLAGALGLTFVLAGGVGSRPDAARAATVAHITATITQTATKTVTSATSAAPEIGRAHV